MWVTWLCISALLCGAAGNTAARGKVLLLSFDGFRWDYVDRFDTPNLDQLASEGVHAPLGVRPAFVTKTFPNHYTLATGLYEESHGIVSNVMYDSLFNATFTNRNNETRWWDGGQPVWTTATLQGLKVGVYAWPGSNVRLNNVWPYKFQPYVKSVPFEKRIETLVHWLSQEDVDLALAYFHEPDNTGHRKGAMSSDVEKEVQRVDALLGALTNRMKEAGIFNTTDLLLVSDHGMTNVTADQEHLVVVSDYLDMNLDVEIMPDSGPLANILPKPGRLEDAFRKLDRAHPNMTVYRKEDIPERYHYKKHRRILPLVAIVDEGYYILKERPTGPDARPIGPGEHGYDNDLPSMRPIFFARGPSFKAGHKVPETFETVNVYPLVCHLLGIQAAPNNGTFWNFAGMLRNQAARPNVQALLVPLFHSVARRFV